MFHFDADDSHFPSLGSQSRQPPKRQEAPKLQNNPWSTFAAKVVPPPKPNAWKPIESKVALVPSNGVQNGRRRPSVVLHGHKAILLTNEEPKLQDERTSRQLESGITSLANLTLEEPSVERSKSPAPKKKKNKSKNTKAKRQELIRSALQDDDHMAPKSNTSTAFNTDVEMSDTDGATAPKSIQFPKRLSPPRLDSMVSSLSTSFQEARANFPQLSINTSNGTSELKSRLELHADDMISVDGHQGSSYEVQLESEFMSPDVHKISPLKAMMDVQDAEANGTNGLVSGSGNKMCAEDFEPLRMLGKGTYGTVLLVRHKATGRLYAQKQLKKASIIVHTKMVEQTKTERNILESIRHPFVVKLFYAFQDHKKLYLILEYAQGGELFNYLAIENIFSEDTTAFYIAELVLALEHLHNNVGVVYRDLKPENCLLDSDGHLLMTDFGLSKVAEEGARCKSVLGTPEYMAPEILQGKQYGFEVDWWSLGALTYDLLTGGPPFPGNNHTMILEKITKKKLQLPYFLSAESKDILTRLLRKEPTRRLGANMPGDISIIKKHRFFRKIDWVKLERRELEAPIKPLVTDPALAENFAKEFTDAQMSPVISRGQWGMTTSFKEGNGSCFGNGDECGSYGNWMAGREQNDPFGGFSYQASSVMDGYFRDF